MAIQSVTRGALRRSVGKNLGIVIDGVATAASADKSSLEDTKNLLGGDDEHNQKEVMIYETTDKAVPQDESSIVSNFTAASNIATCVPIFTAEITILDKYEMWTYPWRMADINDAINQAINEVTNKALQIKETHDTITESSKYLYDVLSSFTHLFKVEYVNSIGTEVIVDKCETIWTKGSANVTVTLDTAFEKEGSGCVKAVEDGGSGTNAILAYHAISSTDIDDCDKIEFWMYSSIALTAGQLKIKLDDTAAIASALEAIDIPAMTAATWYRHSLSLANPHTDVDLISVGIFQVSDVGAFTFYVDDIRAVKDGTKEYKEMPIEYWDIAQGATPYLMLTKSGLSLVGTETQLRLTGFRIPVRLDADSTASEIDPAYLIAQVTGRLLVSHAKSSYLDIHDRASLSQYWLGQAARLLPGICTTLPGSIREVQA